eukprot:403338363
MRFLSILQFSLSVIGFVNSQSTPSLRDDGSFKIVQFSNLYVDNSGTNYAFTMLNIQNVIDNEQPDFVVLTGDTVSPFMEDSYTNRFQEAVQYLQITKIPWVSTGGQDRPGNEVDRQYMFDQEQEIGLELDPEGDSLSFSGLNNPNPEKLGLYTGRIPIMTHDLKDVAFNLWIIDSLGGQDCYGIKQGKSCISKESVEWFNEEAAKIPKNKGFSDLLFTTYPLQEYMTAANTQDLFGNFQQQVCCQADNTGIFDAAFNSHRVGLISCGGDALNDFSTNFKGIQLVYGRKSGYGGQRELDMGARVFNIDGKSGKIDQWIREYDGDVFDQSKLKYTRPATQNIQTQCCAIEDVPEDIGDDQSNDGEIKWIDWRGSSFLE